MPTQPLTDPRSWRTDTIDKAASWYHPLSEPCLAALHQSVLDWRRLRTCAHAGVPVTEVALSGAAQELCQQDLRPARAALEEGRGFVVITGLPVECYALQELQLLYWLVGQGLGHPCEQNVQGTLLYDVRDTGQNVAYGARFSVTNAESSFHTDNSFGDAVIDYVGLLCVRGAQSGGLSQVVSGWTVYQELLAQYPDVLETLSQPFHVDRRGGVRPGETPTARHPVVECRGDDLLYRYLRYWIEAGHQKVGEPLTPAQLRALDTLDGWFNRPELRAEFTLRPGEMFFINNRWIVHNRTAFQDHADLEQRRHYMRLWLQRLTA